MAEYIDCVYWGVFFPDGGLPESTLENDTAYKHITFGYMKPCPEHLVGGPVEITICGYGNNALNEAVLVSFPEEYCEYYAGASNVHITLSTAAGAKPVDSANLDFEQRDPYCVTGVFGYYAGNGEYHYSI